MTDIKRDIYILNISMEALASKFPLSRALSSLLEKNFKPLNTSEAYDILSFLVKACSEKRKFKSLDPNFWEKVDISSRISVEKFKKDVLVAIKEISMEGREEIPGLKKSDLMVPYCPRFFSCCSGLSSYALSYQLMCLGTNFWPKLLKSPSPSDSEEILMFLQSEKEGLTQEIQLYKEDTTRLNEQVEYLKSELTARINLKNSLRSQLHDLVDKCTFLNKDDLKDEILRCKALERATKTADDLSKQNARKLKTLMELDETLDFVKNVLECPFEKFVIDGKQLSAKISYETRMYAERERIKLFDSGLLDLQSLLHVVPKSFHKCSKWKIPVYEKLNKLCELRPPSYEPTLLEKLEGMKQKLNEQIAEHLHSLGECLDKKEVNEWFEDFFTPIPSLNFNFEVVDQNVWRNPIADEKKIECLISSKHHSSMKADNSSASVMLQLNPSDSWKFKYYQRRNCSSANLGLTGSSIAKSFGSTNSFLKQKYTGRRSSSTLSLASEESPVSTVKKESIKIRKHKLLRRRSKSSSNLGTTELSTWLAANGSPGLTDDRKDHLCSTPKADEVFFEGDKSISPISIHSMSVGEKPPLQFSRSSIVSNESASFNNRSQCSWPSSFTSNSVNETKNTFDSTASFFPELSLDSLKSLSACEESTKSLLG